MEIQNSANDSSLQDAEKQIKNDQLEIKLTDILSNPGTDFDYILKNGDQINIPEISQAVRVSGEIQNPIGQAFIKGKNLKYYINRAGGYNEKARRGRTFAIYSNGTTKVTRTFFWHKYPKIEPGCQIIVPQKPERAKTDNTGKWLAIASTITTILVAITRL
jgi:protein involved in polysaccharide export with SLBB domain